MVAVAYTLSVAYHLVRRLCDELGCHSTVAGDIDQVVGWGSMVQEPAVGTLLVVVEGRLVVGNSVAVGKELVHTLVAVDLMDMEAAAHRLLVAEEALESMAEEGQLCIDRDINRNIKLVLSDLVTRLSLRTSQFAHQASAYLWFL